VNAERLFAEFERLSEAPDAVPRLRRFILDLAIRGKVVEQETTDEPASALVTQIAKELARSSSRKRNLPPLDPTEITFSLPVGWEWVRIREITGDRGQKIPYSDFTYIDVGSIDKEAGRVSNATVLSAGTAPSRARKVVQEGDVVYSCVRPYLLNVAVVDQGISPLPIASTAFAVLNAFGLVVPRYIWIVLRSPFMVEQVERKMRGQAYPAINDSDFALLPFPLPPLDEQHRIVARVAELMELCDQLEASQAERERRRDRLAIASLGRLENTMANRADGEFHLAHFATIHLRQESIARLRQALLQLAIRGRLVRQNPEDEPASQVLGRLRADRIGSARRRAGSAPLHASATGGPFELPEGWAWARLPELGKFGRGKSKHRPRNDPALFVGGTNPFVQTGDVARSRGRVTTYTSRYNDVGLAQSAMWPEGTLCITIAANIADTGILTFDACFPDSVVGLVPDRVFPNAKYFEYFLRTAQTALSEFAPSTAQKNINLSILNELVVPLPPIAELNRIVARLDELMAVCDELERALMVTRTGAARLLEAVLAEALAESGVENRELVSGRPR
jgi:type I restriction enzyme S subunit